MKAHFKKYKINGLLPKVVIAIVAGVICSLFFPLWAGKIFVTFNSIFSSFLSLFIPLLIIGLIAPSIAELGEGAGKMLLITVAIAYFSTILAGFFSYFTCDTIFPSFLGNSVDKLSGVEMSGSIEPYFTIDMPPFISITSALVISFIVGLGLSSMRGGILYKSFVDFRGIVFKVISKVIIPLLPLFIFGIFLKMGLEGNVAPILGMLLKVILVIFAMHVLFLVFQFVVAGLIAGVNPFKALLNMLPAYATALGTQSSAATIPVTLARTKVNGVHDEVADFTIPLCATIHLSCSILKIVACAYAISLSSGMDLGLGTYAGFIMMLGITMVAAPGVPGGAIMASLGLLSSMLGFTSEMQGMMIALYIVMDSFGTAGNVTGDGAISLIVDRIKYGKRK